MNFEARYIRLDPPGDPDALVVAIWCRLSGRLRRFSADNVRDAQAAGHCFYVRDDTETLRNIHVGGEGSLTALVQALPGSEWDALRGLPAWNE